MENQSRLAKVREALQVEANIVAEVNGGIIHNGQEGRDIEKTHIFVSPLYPTEKDFDDFRAGLLRGTEGVYDWDRSKGGRLYAFEINNNFTNSVEIQMFPDVEVALEKAHELSERLQR